MKQGTIWLIGFCAILFVVLLALGCYMNSYGGGNSGQGNTLVTVSFIPLLAGIAASLPTIIPIVKARKYRHDVETGKINTYRRKYRNSSYFDDLYNNGTEDASEAKVELSVLISSAHNEFVESGKSANSSKSE